VARGGEVVGCWRVRGVGIVFVNGTVVQALISTFHLYILMMLNGVMFFNHQK